MRSKQAALIAALLLLTTACSRSAPAPVSPSSGVAPAVPELPPAKVTVPAEAIVSTLDLASLPRKPLDGSTPTHPVDSAAEAEREKARANLISLLEASPATPAKGLEEAALAYYRRPDVAALYPPLADPPHAARITEVVGTKDEPSPFKPTVIRLGSIYEGASPWFMSILQWQSGGKIFAASIKEIGFSALRGVTYQGHAAFLIVTGSDPNGPPILVAYEDKGGQLQPLTLADQAPIDGATWVRKAPNQLQFPAKPASAKPGYGWACFTASCVTLGWSDATGLAITPAGFGPAEAQKRLTDTDGNIMQAGFGNAREQIGDRVTAPGAMDATVKQLAERTGATVAAVTSGDVSARVVHLNSMNWMAGRSYQVSAMWLLVRSPGAPDQALYVDSGSYVDHRILRDGDQTYILLLTDVQPKPDTKRNNLQIFALQGGQLQLLQLPETLGFNRKVFTSMDGRLMLTCTDFLNAPAACGAIRIEGGKLMILKQGALAGQPATEAQQASEQANAKFKAGAYVEAAQTFRQTVELAPTWIDAWNDLSFAYQKAGDWQAALIAARTASNLDAKSGAALYNAGVSYLGLGDSSRAISMLDQAVKLQADSPDTWLALGKAREQARLRVTAVEAYKKVLALDAGNKEAADGLKRVQALMDAK